VRGLGPGTGKEVGGLTGASNYGLSVRSPSGLFTEHNPHGPTYTGTDAYRCYEINDRKIYDTDDDVRNVPMVT